MADSPKEIMARLSAYNDCLKVSEALHVAMNALGGYATGEHPDGQAAREAIERIEAITDPDRVAPSLSEDTARALDQQPGQSAATTEERSGA